MTVTPTPSADLADLLAGRGLLSGQPRTVVRSGDDSWEAFYRDRWAHDKVVRTTHGVNCTGSCAWNVFVKDGLVTWEHQFTGYPTTGPDSPEYEPRGCPRGASFSWYLYSPSRVRYPYVRGVLLDLYRAERADGRDPVEAWAAITGDPAKTGRYKRARGQGGFVRASWDEVTEIMAAAHVATIRDWGPDRCVGFTPIPAMSMVSFSAGTRFLSLIGGTLLSFYDWYCDLPPASPQVWGDQTDVPESGDWWNAGYLMMWGSNIPTTRTPDSHFMTEVRYRGTKVVTVSPDYSDAAKFADTWLAPHPGTDAALAQAMGHVILTEFYRDQPTPYFQDYARRYTDAPFLIRLEPGPDGAWRPGKFLTAADLPQTALAATANADFRPLVLDLAAAGGPQAVAPNGTEADRFGEAGVGRWNLDLENLDPALSLDGLAGNASPVEVLLPRFDTPVESTAPGADNGATMRRGVPARRIGDHLVTTVFDVLLASYGVARPGLPGQWPSAPAGGTAYDDATAVGTPAWQETITGVPRAQAIQVGREFARNAVETNGRSMIILGAGTNHWFHSDTMYRTFLALLMMCGCQGVNGGGWAHYVGQEKARPVTGQQHMGFALDWARPPRHQASTSFWYTHSDQWRYDTIGANEIASPAGNGQLSGQTFMDCLTQAVRLGWTPGHPGFNRNPLDLTDQAAAAGVEVGPYIASQLKTGALKFAVEDPDDPACFPRLLTLWRANLFGNSAKGSEYFLRHLLGAEDQVTSPEATPDKRPQSVVWRDQPGRGKLDLVTTLDFRMTGTALLSDIVLPAATWYEKADISTTDMHPFVHSFAAAVPPPWQARTDFQIFAQLADKVSELAAARLGVRTDVAPIPFITDTPDEMANPHGLVRDWKTGQVEPIPGRTMPKIVVTQRDYSQIGQKYRTVGPLMTKLGAATKGVTVNCDDPVAFLAERNGVAETGVGAGRPLIDTDVKLADAILAFSGTTNGTQAQLGFEALSQRTGRDLKHLYEENVGCRITYADTRVEPKPVFTSYEWSGSETGGRRYSAFTTNVEELKPWHTVTGRQQFYIDHDWMAELGELLPVYRPPLHLLAHAPAPASRAGGRQAEVIVRYLTPHSKWSIHSQYQDNPFMLALSRGGPVIWLSVPDAEQAGIKDNDWIEAYNNHGVITARAIVSHRIPAGLVYMYHSKDRNVDVPKTESTGRRGGTHNAVTRLYMKPSHLLGGYGQLSYGFNYYGPTGNQRDELTRIRRRSQEVEY